MAAFASLPGSVELLLVSVASLLPPRRRSRQPGYSAWRVAVVIPAHNEAANIASCVQSLLASDRDGMEVDIFVVADNCADDTGRVAASEGARVLTRTSRTERGKWLCPPLCLRRARAARL